ncbi:ATP-dependent DNA helicase RecG [Mycolicibacterium flavescens]|uniref:ATP-dependent DNA helicase RecG n=1 Tax=Mycolicibacterium flavescens TaxID=1776 RepID=A0A1E3RR80_MYCFV|nr:ATP-dependent DNA helicase RecG [Mycolicibacterium flavescens]MCV7279708.1 ATP-dependent DNA helicase RecG [Mycolicibacterium flavescens]ODQ92351.1 ATP-dependent DNA helicase RecG [Mycolicibacterium flavescens]
MATLSDRLDFVLGKKAAGPLAEHFGIHTVNDLLRHYPRKYSDEMTTAGENEELEEGVHVTFVDTITGTTTGDMKPQRDKKGRIRKRKWLRVTLGGRGRAVTATFFNADWMIPELVEGTRLILSGEVDYFRGALQLTHPAFLVLESPGGRTIGTKSMKTIVSTSGATGDDLLAAFERDFFPIYPANKKVQTWEIYACVRQVLDVLDPIPEPLPESFLRQHGLITEDEALRAVHTAERSAERDAAIARLTYDEALGLQWALAERRHGELGESGPAVAPRDDGLVAAMRERLPFELTAGQRDVLEVLTAELAATRPMNRMLQGEVGSGKTIVSVMAMLQMVDGGYQCALLAPTEVLAAQHARSIRDVLGPLGMAGQLGGADGATRVALLTGSMSAPQKRAVREEVAGGEAGIVIGTHALLQDAVEFSRLGMVVVDEQHRFGVEQRDRLRSKAPDGVTPHLLVMTATPIPRTVALTHYGDLETSTLRELPRGRQPITTNTIFLKEKPRWLERAWQRIIEEVGAGRQAYIVASRIDESDKDKKDNKNGGPPPITVVELFDRLSGGPLSGLRLGLMHGRLPADEKDAVMGAFRSGEIDVLVCTTVIEVGVDVPNATVMLVMDADRFGISQLHQLRGRIGRGQHPSLCLLATRLPEMSKAGQRLKAVAATLDGFALADLDLEERQEGDVLGHSQSGRAITLRFLSLQKHLDVIVEAREFCTALYERDPGHVGMAALAAPFTDDRVEFLDKA